MARLHQLDLTTAERQQQVALFLAVNATLSGWSGVRAILGKSL